MLLFFYASSCKDQGDSLFSCFSLSHVEEECNQDHQSEDDGSECILYESSEDVCNE